MLVLHYALTPEDHYQFNFYRFWQSPEARNGKRKAYLRTLTTLFLGFIAMNWFLGIPFFTWFMAAYLLFGLIILLLLPDLFRRQIRKNVNKLLKDPNNKSYTSPTELIVTEEGITNKDEFSESRYDWKAIIRQEETPGYYFLYLSSILVVTIPKRALSPAEQNQLNEYLSRYVSFEAALGRI